MAELAWQSALGGLAAEEAAIELGEVGRQIMVDLRISPKDRSVKSAVADALGFKLPETPRTSTTKERVWALWLSIDQWLVVAPYEYGVGLPKTLGKATAKGHANATDMSDARIALRLEGPGARSIIMKGGAADLLGADFVPGSVRRLNFAGVAAFVHYYSDKPEVLDLYILRSFADYTYRWLEIASRPGAAVQLFDPAPPPPV